MPQLVDIPEVGRVQFPDEMDDDAIVGAIAKLRASPASSEGSESLRPVAPAAPRFTKRDFMSPADRNAEMQAANERDIEWRKQAIPVGDRGPIEELQRPLVNLPEMSDEDINNLVESGMMSRPHAELLAGINRGAARTASALTSPVGIATLGEGALAKAGTPLLSPGAQRAISGTFAAQMGAQLPGEAGRFGTALGAGDVAGAAESGAGFASSALFARAAAGHALGIEPPPTPPAQVVGEQMNRLRIPEVDPRSYDRGALMALDPRAGVPMLPQPPASPFVPEGLAGDLSAPNFGREVAPEPPPATPEPEPPAEPAAPTPGGHYDSTRPPMGFEQVPQPEQFNSVDEILQFRAVRLSEERKLYQNVIGLDEEQAAKLQSILMREGDTGKFEKSLTPQQQAKLNWFFDEAAYNQRGDAFQSWETNKRFNPAELTDEDDHNFLGRSLIAALDTPLEPKINNDRFLYAAIAAMRLRDTGATMLDLAKAANDYARNTSGSEGDAKFMIERSAEKLAQFLKSQGIQLPERPSEKLREPAKPEPAGPTYPPEYLQALKDYHQTHVEAHEKYRALPLDEASRAQGQEELDATLTKARKDLLAAHAEHGGDFTDETTAHVRSQQAYRDYKEGEAAFASGEITKAELNELLGKRHEAANARDNLLEALGRHEKGTAKRFAKLRAEELAKEVAAEKAARTKEAKPKRYKRSFISRPSDIMDELEAIGKIRSRVHMRPGEEGYYDDDYREVARGNSRLFSKFGMSPDEAADSLRQRGALGPDASVNDMWMAINRAKANRRKYASGEAPEQKAERFYEASDPAGKNKDQKVITVGDLEIGDQFRLDGEDFKVTHVDPDTGEVTVADGRKFGHQTIPEGAEIAIDKEGHTEVPRPDIEADWDDLADLAKETKAKQDAKFSTFSEFEDAYNKAHNEGRKIGIVGSNEEHDSGIRLKALAEANPVFHKRLMTKWRTGQDLDVPAPKLRAGEDQGDLLSKQQEDFKLVGEKGTDFARIQAEREQAERDRAESEKKQGGLFSEEDQADAQASLEKEQGEQGNLFGMDVPEGGNALRATPQQPGAPGATPAPTRRRGTATPQQQMGAVKKYWYQRAARWVQNQIAPHTIDDTARLIGNIIREYNAESALEVAQADAALRTWRNSFNRTPVSPYWTYDPTKPLPRNYAFMDNSELGGANLQPGERALKRLIDDLFAKDVLAVQAMSPNALRNLIQDYFPHMWKDPVQAQQVFAQIYSKRPLEGTRDFLKKRTQEYFLDGIRAGLEPVSDNPIDIVLFKHAEIQRFIMARKVLAEAKKIGARKFVYAYERAPYGWSKVDDRTSTVTAPPFVEIKEAFDAQMRAKTIDLMRQLGVPHERLVKMRGQRWGEAQDLGGGNSEIRTRFGGPDSVIWHELGHALEFRYKLSNELAGTTTMRKELRALADQRLGQSPSPGMQKYVREMDEKMATVLQAYLHAPELMQKVAPNVMQKFKEIIRRHPELHAIDDIKPSLEIGAGKALAPVNGIVTLGHWYMPDGAAQVLNNFLSPGLGRNPVYRGLRQTGNLLNTAQLGFSAFHLGFTSLDAAASRATLGLEELVSGRPIKGVLKLLTTPIAPITNIVRGHALQSEMLKPGSAPEMNAIARLAVMGGLRATADPLWRSEFSTKFRRAMSHLPIDQDRAAVRGVTGAMALPFHALDKLVSFIPEMIVPRQKLGVFADMAKSQMERMGPNATVAQVREAMAVAADSVENRMGQMTYDNLFYNRMVKDLAQLGFRSFGWQLGKYREITNAALDTGRAARSLSRLERPKITNRMLYPVGLAMTVGAVGGVMHRLMTGKNPEQLMDYYFPGTGRIMPNGKMQRLSLPSYLKDMVSDWHDFPSLRKMGPSFYHKLNPMISLTADMLRNRDFYDVQIRNEDDSPWQKGLDISKFLAKGFIPFSVSGGMKLAEDSGSTARDWVLPFFGFVPAKKSLTLTPAEARAADLMQDQLPRGARTADNFAKGQMMQQIMQTMRTDPKAGLKAMAGAAQAGTVTKGNVLSMLQNLHLTPLQFQMRKLPPEAGMSVWDLASPAERNSIRLILAERVANSETLSPQKKDQFLKVLKQKR